MTFNYSICHPDKELIEYPTELIDAQKAIELAKTYPWKEQLQLCDELPDAKIYYSPSLDFKNTQGKSSFGITRSEEHTSELQSRPHLVCRLLLEKKKKKK